MADEMRIDGNSSRESSSRDQSREIARIAARQDGLISRQQLRRQGATDNQIAHSLSANRLIQVHRGVYAVGHGAVTRRARLRAATMVGPGVALSHTSAAEWWAIVGGRTGPVHVTASRRIERPHIVSHTRTLPPDELEADDGVPLTSVSRTLFDLASDGRDALESALRKAEFRQLTSQLSLHDLLTRYPGARGSATVRGVLADGLYLLAAESPLEELFLRFLHDRRIGLPEVNVTLEANGRRYRVDCLFRAAGLVVELDGRDAHARELAFERDRERDGDLLAAGLRVLRITRRQLERDPAAVERRLRAALGA